MTASRHGVSEDPTPFGELLEEVMADAKRLGHREHVHLAWLAVRRFGTDTAVDVVGKGIKRIASDAGSPRKYHVTVTRAWIELVGHHASQSDGADFDSFAGAHPALLDRELLARFYRPSTLGETPA